ncbi:phage holin family protein [Streptomyces sp. NBC_00015]|uniref:phage holin family protein n=1 Tax=Streptomyces sp. NBC_00015 TaxID=2903611 RepID=UPI00324703F5
MTGTTDIRPVSKGHRSNGHRSNGQRSDGQRSDGHHRDGHQSVGELVGQATEQLSRLVRQELALAKHEFTEKGRRAGRGGGLLGAAGAFAYAGLLALAGTGVAALSLTLPVWAAALIVTAVLFVIAGVLAAVGRGQLRRAAPPTPEETLGSVRADVEEIKERAHR